MKDRYLYIDEKEVLNDLRDCAYHQEKTVAQCIREAVRFYVYSGQIQSFFVSGGICSGNWIVLTK